MADVRSGVQKKKGVSEGVSDAFVTKKSDRTFGYPTPESLPAATDAKLVQDMNFVLAPMPWEHHNTAEEQQKVLAMCSQLLSYADAAADVVTTPSNYGRRINDLINEWRLHSDERLPGTKSGGAAYLAGVCALLSTSPIVKSLTSGCFVWMHACCGRPNHQGCACTGRSR